MLWVKIQNGIHSSISQIFNYTGNFTHGAPGRSLNSVPSSSYVSEKAVLYVKLYVKQKSP